MTYTCFVASSEWVVPAGGPWEGTVGSSRAESSGPATTTERKQTAGKRKVASASCWSWLGRRQPAFAGREASWRTFWAAPETPSCTPPSALGQYFALKHRTWATRRSSNQCNEERWPLSRSCGGWMAIRNAFNSSCEHGQKISSTPDDEQYTRS